MSSSYVFMIVSTVILAGLFFLWLHRFAPNNKTKYLGAGVLLGWLVISAVIGQLGVLGDFTQLPPRFFFFLIFMFVIIGCLLFSRWGYAMVAASPLRILVGFQAFRFLPEILLDLAWRDGLAPIQMTFHGQNFDILTAIAALILFVIWPRLKSPRAWAWGFSVLGLALLLNIVVVAILSTPVPFRVFMNEPANVFVTTFPYIWLPGVHVFLAFLFHGLAIRKLLQERV